MASVVSLGRTHNTTAGNKTFTGTSVTGDLIVVVVVSTGVTTSSVTDNDGGTYTKVAGDYTGFSTSGFLSIWVRNALVASGKSTIYTANQASSTGGGLHVLRLTGIPVAGSSAVRGSGGQSTGTAGTTPAPVLSTTPTNFNPIITAVANGTNSSTTVVQRSGYSEDGDSGYNTPATGFEVAHLASGETSATLTHGGNSASAFASLAIEIKSIVTATPAVVSTTISVNAPTTSFAEVASRSPNTVSTSISVQTPTKSYVEIYSTTPTTASITASVQAPTAVGLIVFTATPNEINTTIGVQALTTSYVLIIERTPDTVVTTASINAPTAGYYEVDTISVSAINTTISINAPTTSYAEIYSKTPSSVDVNISVQSPTKSYEQVNTALPLSVDTTINVNQPTTSSEAIFSKSPSEIPLTSNAYDATATFEEVRTATPLEITLAISISDVTTDYVGSFIETTPITAIATIVINDPETSYEYIAQALVDAVILTAITRQANAWQPGEVLGKLKFLKGNWNYIINNYIQIKL